jgi:hypothetical protein
MAESMAELVSELVQGTVWFIAGFLAAVVSHPFVAGWWTNGEE